MPIDLSNLVYIFSCTYKYSDVRSINNLKINDLEISQTRILEEKIRSSWTRKESSLQMLTWWDNYHLDESLSRSDSFFLHQGTWNLKNSKLRKTWKLNN